MVAAVVAGGCSNGGDDAADVTPAPPTAAPATAAPATGAPASNRPAEPTAPLFATLGDFVVAFDSVGASGAIPAGSMLSLADAAMTTGPLLPSGGDGFVTAEAIPSGILGGTLDADGAVAAVFVFVDPLTASAAPAVLSLIATMAATPAQFDQSAFAIEYRQLAIEAASRVDDQFWTPSTNGSGHSLVTTVVGGASGSNNLIEVAIVPIADEAEAKAAVRPIRNEVIGLLAG